jgi:hypothetical protein
MVAGNNIGTNNYFAVYWTESKNYLRIYFINVMFYYMFKDNFNPQTKTNGHQTDCRQAEGWGKKMYV